MAGNGPPPKRSEERRRRNRAEVDRAPSRTVKSGPAPPRGMSGLARRWYESLRTSGQSVYYTDSDWATAMVVAKGIERYEERPSAVMLSAILSGATALAATEGDRRRVRLELQRETPVDADEEAAVAALDSYRNRKSG